LVVVEDLVEVVDACEQLVGDGGGDTAVVDDGDVLDVDGRDLVVGEKLRTYGRDLAALSDEPVGADAVFTGEGVVDLGETVPAVAELGILEW